MKGKSPVIALVDDDKIFQLTSARMIEALDLSRKILQFSNGEEALQYLKNYASDSDNLPDFIFLDINMPMLMAGCFLRITRR